MVLDEDWIICKPLGNNFVRVKRNNKGISPTCYRKNNVHSKNKPFGKRSKPKHVKELGYKFLVSILHDWREGLKPLRFLVKCLHWKGSLQSCYVMPVYVVLGVQELVIGWRVEFYMTITVDSSFLLGEWFMRQGG